MIKPLSKILALLLIILQTILPIITNDSAASSAITISVGQGIAISDSYKRAKESDDTRLKALYAIRGGQQAYDTYNQYSNSQNSGGSGAGSAIQVKIGYSNTRQRSETITQSNTTVSSDINAQGNVSIKATGDPDANKGDLAVVGSNIQGKNVSLEAARDIALQSSADTFDSASRNSSSHFSAGVVVGTSGYGVYAEGARGRGKENEDNVTHKETTVTATDTLTINSGQDTNLKGAIAKGQTIKADVGRNLNIESEQDTSTYKARQQNMSGSAQVTYGGGGNASASYMQSKADADYKSVQEQSGLFAGNGGYDIKVAKNTDLKGAVIASDATADKNTLTTETLTYSDISNRSKYSASSFGGSIGGSYGGGSGSISGAPSLGMPSSDSVSGTTRSAVAPGTINTTSNIASLSRDTKNANGSVKNIFDKKKVATNQEVAQVFSEVAYHAVGDIAKSQTKPYEDAKLRYEVAAEQSKAAKQSGDTEKQAQAEAAMAAAQNDMAANQSAYDTWKDGSPAKIALHALVGTLSAAMGKGDIAGGALGAGVSEALSNVTNQLPKALQPLASAIIGAAVSQATGGNPMSGGSTALAGDLYNRQLHQAEREYLKNNKAKFIRWYLNEYMDSSRTIADIAKDAERIWNDAINGSGGRTSDDTASPFFDGTIQATPSKPPIAKFFEKVNNDVISLFGNGVREKQDVFMEYLGYLVTGASGISRGSLSAEVKALQATGESGAIELGGPQIPRGLVDPQKYAGVSLTTEADQAYFWSGLGRGGDKVAADMAAARGGLTLEQVMNVRGIELPAWDANNALSVQAWQNASRAFADGASGEVRAIIGNSLRPGNIWETIELPALKANPKVTRIIKVDPTTGEEAVIFSRRK